MEENKAPIEDPMLYIRPPEPVIIAPEPQPPIDIIAIQQNTISSLQNDVKNLHSALNTLINSINAGKNNISQ